MARLWTAGAELQTTTAGIEYSANGTNAPAIETTTKRSGAAAWRINNAATEFFRQAYTAAQGVYFFRFYLYVVTLPSVATKIVGGFMTTGSTFKVTVRMTTAGVLELYNSEDSAQIGSSSSAISTATWYRVEIGIDTTTLASTTAEARLYAASAEGTLLWNPSGTINLAANPTSIFCGHDGETAMDFIVDDLAVNDNSGSFQNSWPGEGEVIVLRPNAAGDYTTWTRGGTDSGADWSQTSEVPPDGVTSYIQENTNNADPTLCSDDFNLEATPAAMASNDVINVVHVGTYAAVDNVTGGDPDIALRIKAAASGTVEESASLDVNSLTYQGPAPLPANANYQLTLYDLPGASTTAWTKADLDTAQVGVRLAVTDTHFARVSALWVMVDHKPAGATAYTLAVDVGAYALTGMAAGLRHDYLLAVDVGLYNLTGVSAALNKGKILVVDVGTYALTGNTAALKVARKITPDVGLYNLTGLDATLTYTPTGGYTLAVDVGAYSLTGVAVGLKAGRVVVPAVGLYNITGLAATLTYTPHGAYTLTVNVGAYSLTGVSPTLLWKRRLPAALGTYALTGVNAGTLKGRLLSATTGSYALTGIAAGLRKSNTLAAVLGLYLLNGLDATLTYTGAAFPYQPTQPIIYPSRDVIEVDGQTSVQVKRSTIETDIYRR